MVPGDNCGFVYVVLLELLTIYSYVTDLAVSDSGLAVTYRHGSTHSVVPVAVRRSGCCWSVVGCSLALEVVPGDSTPHGTAGATAGGCSGRTSPHGRYERSCDLSLTSCAREGGTSPYGGSSGASAVGRRRMWKNWSVPRDVADPAVLSTLLGSGPGCTGNHTNGESRGKEIGGGRGAAPLLGSFEFECLSLVLMSVESYVIG